MYTRHCFKLGWKTKYKKIIKRRSYSYCYF